VAGPSLVKEIDGAILEARGRMDRSEKRRDPRIPLVLRVEYPSSAEPIRGVTENLSAGGLFLRTDRELPQGARVPLLVSFPGLLEPLEIEVEVVWCRAASADGPAGVAVRIPEDRFSDRAQLGRLVESVRTPRTEPTGRRYRVLVVEDNPHVIEMYEYALHRMRSGQERIDMAVDFGTNGHEALARLRTGSRVDLVITDLYMPVMDGFALLEQIRADPALMETPVVVISAGGQDARDRAAELGVDVFLRKPVQFIDVIQTVQMLLRIAP